MVRMLPDIISDSVKSTAEKKLFSEFKDYPLDEDVIILHSLGVAEHANNIFGEIDFVILCHDGFLCVEVKGGSVERKAGNWTFTNRYGVRETRQEGPFDQARGNMLSLRAYMIKHFGKNHPFSRAQYATCVLMPDCTFSNNGVDITREVLFDRSTGCDLKSIIRASFSYWRDDCDRQHGFRGGYLSDEEVKEAANLLRGDFRFVPSLRDVIDSVYRELLALTDEQYEVLESLEDNPRLLISGLAGTGKSVLAVEQCKRVSRYGKNVLYLCFNRNMAMYARSQFEKEGLTAEAYTLHSLLVQICGNAYDSNTDYFYSVELPRRFLNDPGSIRQYDFVVIDEGQDLISSTYLECVDRLIRNGLKNGSWAIFFDPNQNIYNNEAQMNAVLPSLRELAASYSLTVNCRNTREIAAANTLMTNIPQATRLKASGPRHEVHAYHTLSDEREAIISLIDRLHEEGVKYGEIVILSAYSEANNKCFLSCGGFPGHLSKLKTSGQMWRARQDELRFSTISSFKGLEARVIILADVDSFQDSSRRLLNYVGISRAQIALHVFYLDTVENERQQMLLEGYKKLR